MVGRNSTRLLVDRARRGERAAFDQLVETHQEPLRRFIASRIRLYTGPKLDVDEIRQEAFTRAFESIDRFQWQGKGSFFRWLCGIAKHALMKAAENSRRTERLESGSKIPAGDASPSRILRRVERLQRLQSSLDGLPADYRQVIRLARIEGLGIKAIAERLGRSPDSVKHLLARALARLKADFGDTESLHLPDEGLQFQDGDHGEP